MSEPDPRLLLLAPLVIAAAWLRHMVARHGAGPLIWRWFSGHPLDGKHRTDASWTRSSMKTLHPTGRVVRWHHLPRLHRGVIRTLATLATPPLAVGLATRPWLTLAVLGVLILALALAFRGRVRRGLLQWRHQRAWVRPLGRALAAELGTPPTRLVITPDRSRVIIGLGDEFTGGERERAAVTQAVTAKLAIEAPDAEWSLTGRKPQVTFTQSKPPPARVAFADIRQAIEDARAHEIVWGIGRRGEVVKNSVDTDSPHVGLSMKSGDGKSTVAKNAAAQLAFHGALLLVIDYKLISHMWARGLPNVAYAGTEEEITIALMWLQEEIRRRNGVALAGADIEGEVHSDVGPPVFVIAEELNATQDRLRAYWRAEGGKGRPPAAEALDEAMFIGRQVRVHILQIGQRLSAKASGSGDARENLGIRLMCDPSGPTWKMLGFDHAQPPPSGHKGRLQVVTAKTVREVQGAFLTGAQARAFATAGTIAVPRADMPLVAVPGPGQLPDDGAEQPSVLGHGPVVPALPGAVTLSEAVRAGVFRSLEAVRKERQRYREVFPAPVGQRGSADLFDIGDLYQYAARKAEFR